MAIPALFIRDDDVVSSDPVFMDLFACHERYHLPVVYGVIPAQMKNGLRSFLLQKKKKDPRLFDIVQHGLWHRNYGGKKRKYEFGHKRSYQEQYSDIHQGFQIMEKAFGSSFTPAFIPPFHGWDRATVKAVKDVGLTVFSSGSPIAGRHPGIIDMPAQSSLNSYAADGTPEAFDAARLLRILTRAMMCGGVTGMVYHHQVLNTPKDVNNMKVFIRAVARARDEGKVRVVLFSDILRVKYPVLMIDK